MSSSKFMIINRFVSFLRVRFVSFLRVIWRVVKRNVCNLGGKCPVLCYLVIPVLGIVGIFGGCFKNSFVDDVIFGMYLLNFRPCNMMFGFIMALKLLKEIQKFYLFVKEGKAKKSDDRERIDDFNPKWSNQLGDVVIVVIVAVVIICWYIEGEISKFNQAWGIFSMCIMLRLFSHIWCDKDLEEIFVFLISVLCSFVVGFATSSVMWTKKIFSVSFLVVSLGIAIYLRKRFLATASTIKKLISLIIIMTLTIIFFSNMYILRFERFWGVLNFCVCRGFKIEDYRDIESGLYDLKLLTNENLVYDNVLFLSDLHFSGDSDFNFDHEFAILKNVLSFKNNQRDFDLIVVLGDVAYGGTLSEFEQAYEFLKKLAGKSDVVVIPGNHDVAPFLGNLINCEAEYERFARFFFKDSKIQIDPLMRIPVVTFEGEDVFPLKIRLADDHMGRKRFLFLLDSNMVNTFHLAQGKLGDSQMKKMETMMTKLMDVYDKKVVFLIGMHHHPVDNPITNEKDWGTIEDKGVFIEDILGKFPKNIEMVIFGHRHDAWRLELSFGRQNYKICFISVGGDIFKEQTHKNYEYGLAYPPLTQNATLCSEYDYKVFRKFECNDRTKVMIREEEIGLYLTAIPKNQSYEVFFANHSVDSISKEDNRTQIFGRDTDNSFDSVVFICANDDMERNIFLRYNKLRDSVVLDVEEKHAVHDEWKFGDFPSHIDFHYVHETFFTEYTQKLETTKLSGTFSYEISETVVSEVAGKMTYLYEIMMSYNGGFFIYEHESETRLKKKLNSLISGFKDQLKKMKDDDFMRTLSAEKIDVDTLSFQMRKYFPLTKGTDRSFKNIVFLADFHVGYFEKENLDLSISALNEVYDQVESPEDSLFVFLGDVTHRGRLSEFRIFNLMIKKSRMDYKNVLVVPGNHDFQLFMGTTGFDPKKYKNFLRNFEGVDLTFEKIINSRSMWNDLEMYELNPDNKIFLIAVDSNPKSSNIVVDALGGGSVAVQTFGTRVLDYLSRGRLYDDSIEKIIRYLQKVRSVQGKAIICMHHGPYYPPSTSFLHPIFGDYPNQILLHERETLTSTLKDFSDVIEFVVYGHGHTFQEKMEDGLQYISLKGFVEHLIEKRESDSGRDADWGKLLKVYTNVKE